MGHPQACARTQHWNFLATSMASRCAIMALLLAAGLAAAPPDPGVMSTAKRAFSWARTHLLWAEEGRGAARCTWTRSTYMIGLWEYYARTAAPSDHFFGATGGAGTAPPRSPI